MIAASIVSERQMSATPAISKLAGWRERVAACTSASMNTTSPHTIIFISAIESAQTPGLALLWDRGELASEGAP